MKDPRFENPWTDKEIKVLESHVNTKDSLPEIVSQDKAVANILKSRSIGAVRQRLWKMRLEAIKPSVKVGTNNERAAKKREYQKKYRAKKNKPQLQTTPLNFCPSCGCNLRAVQAALSL